MFETLTPVAFLDRDGVINLDHIYVNSQDRCDWVEDSPKAIARLNQLGYRVVVVTNQSGIGRGIYSEREFLDFTSWMKQTLLDLGARIDEVQYCPHHPREAKGDYLQDCDCRKPKPGMLNRILNQEGYDRAESFLIGDKPTDIQAAEAAGIKGYLFEGGNLNDFLSEVLASRSTEASKS